MITVHLGNLQPRHVVLNLYQDPGDRSDWYRGRWLLLRIHVTGDVLLLRIPRRYDQG